MKKSKYNDSQIMSILKQASAVIAVPEVCKEHGISSRLHFTNGGLNMGGMDLTMITRLKELEQENSRLKKMYTEERLKTYILREVFEKK